MIVSHALEKDIDHFLRNELKVLDWAVTKAERLDPEAQKLEQWLSNNHHGKMSYLENHFDLRVDPSKLVPGAKSVICLMFNYYPKEEQSAESKYKIARYAYGRDYHKIIKSKLKRFHHWLGERLETPEINARFFTDSAPLLERDLAKRAGLGWIGKNTLLLQKKTGSYFFLAEYVSDLEFESIATPSMNYCGTCTRCIDACPTDAISPEGYLLDGSKCISYLTIELKESIPKEYHDKLQDWVFGCDICQEVCPWNRFSKSIEDTAFVANIERIRLPKKEWETMDEPLFEHLFNGSPIRRAGYEKLKGTVRIVRGD